jgi:DNA processing protein
MDDERLAYLTLTQVPGMGPARLKTLLTANPSPLGAFSAPFEFLCTLSGFSRAFATAIKQTTLEIGRKVVHDALGLGVEVLFPDDARFPAQLATIPDPPPVLFAMGDDSLTSRAAIAIVGSRDHSSYGGEVCRMLSRTVASHGLAVVSGMARGLDAVAHSSALECAGSTIGVLGNGHGVIYPAANRELYNSVAQRGLLLSEFPPGERPHPGSFPRRNRLISGLARVTVIVEAAAGSGALITAGTALDQGREVMAVPGSILSPVSVGTNRLIRDGAAPVLEPADLLHHFPEANPITKEESFLIASQRILPDSLTPEERRLAESFGREPIHPDQLAIRCHRPVCEVLALLSGLEIAGVVEQCPGQVFRRL